MSEHERLLAQLGEMLAKIARPYRADDELPVDLRSRLSQMGFACTELTTREELIARLWARKRSLLTGMPPEWGGPGLTPPSAA